MDSEDEDDQRQYTDYSCSTSLERLIRDVETIFRSWHIVDGCDRHVSLHSPTKKDSRLTTLPRSLILRSETLSWEIVYSTGLDEQTPRRQTHTVQLELKLWDGPPVPVPVTTANEAQSGPFNASNDSIALDDLPFSLHQHQQHQSIRCNDQNAAVDSATNASASDHTLFPDDLFANFSSLFGIGQHVTLSPASYPSGSGTGLPKDLLQYIDRCGGQYSTENQKVIRRTDSIDPDLVQDFFIVRRIRHVLSGWLQTALNLAASNSSCVFPLFGIWGHYQPQSPPPSYLGSVSSDTTALPLWMEYTLPIASDDDGDQSTILQRSSSVKRLLRQSSSRQNRSPPSTPPRRRRRPSDTAKSVAVSQQHVHCLPVVSGTLLSANYSASFSCTVLPCQVPMTPDERSDAPESRLFLSTWTSILRQHGIQRAALHGARNFYAWFKVPVGKGLGSKLLQSIGLDAAPDEWRRHATVQTSAHHLDTPAEGSSHWDMKRYRRECHAYAMFLLERASGSSSTNPMWGPSDDPVLSLRATVTWEGMINHQTGRVDPVLTLPLKIRSRKMSRNDWIEMHDNVERMVLDPFRSSKFVVRTLYDPQTATASMTATQRCILAALIRSATLPYETLCSHLIDPELMEQWDHSAGSWAASDLAQAAQADPSTCSLVTAMDWENAAEDLIDQWKAQEIVRQVLDASLIHGFPQEPEHAWQDVNNESNASTDSEEDQTNLTKAAPAGRLLSLLFVHMASVRSPSSMALVWLTFVAEVRRRWNELESLPNMKSVSGIDLSPTSKIQQASKRSGVKAYQSANLCSSEPDPDDCYCLIGQKLQVFNVCVELALFQSCRKPKESPPSPEPLKDDTEKESTQDSPPEPSPTSELHGPSDEDENTSDDEFFDAPEGGEGIDTNACNRKGARCPVLGVHLKSSGEQLFAPYLQRPFPLSDDVLAERRLMIARQRGAGTASSTAGQRLEIARRLQEPKLRSDMQSFKAANPGSEFQDFVSWYGNPSNPLEEYEEAEEEHFQEFRLDDSAGASNGAQSSLDDVQQTRRIIARGLERVEYKSDRKTMEAKAKLDKAAEAIKMLKETREFWSETWEKAESIPAEAQKPIFDAENTAERVLDYFETLHPANLLCQVMAVNLYTSYYVLERSAGDAAMIDAVKQSLSRLKETVEDALQVLAFDAVAALTTASASARPSVPCHVVTLESISKCERACQGKLGSNPGCLTCFRSTLHS